MDELLEMLEEKFPNIDFENEKQLYEKGLLDSVSVVEIISETIATIDCILYAAIL